MEGGRNNGSSHKLEKDMCPGLCKFSTFASLLTDSSHSLAQAQRSLGCELVCNGMLSWSSVCHNDIVAREFAIMKLRMIAAFDPLEFVCGAAVSCPTQHLHTKDSSKHQRKLA